VNDNSSHKPEYSRRIFFALWPAQGIRDVLKKNTMSAMKYFLNENTVRKVPIHNWHLTLAFVGNVRNEILGCCLEQGGQVTANTFSMTLNNFDYFDKSKIIWLGCDQNPTGWYELVNKLNEVLSRCGYKPDRVHPVPHMTILRKAKRPIAASQFDPVVWNIHEFALIESATTDKGTLYSVVKRWPLR